MSSDADYQSFLDKANQPGGGEGGITSKPASTETKTITTSKDVPEILKGMMRVVTYTSETEEPFESVSLEFDAQRRPDEEEFRTLIAAPSSAKIEIWALEMWDPRNTYEAVTALLRRMTSDRFGVRVYRVELDQSRVQYYGLGVDMNDPDRLIGFRAKAVES
ncbi:MAG: hypothetical protein M4579_007503 [Chaenotheca gracillima]|nr:MAG: hypothetical protein M4579_007503 [Chaenotheca gracillima]